MQAFKNALDWGSRDGNVWNNKPAAVMSAGGGMGGIRSVWSLKQSNGWSLLLARD
jgi:chromate reductase